MSLSAYDLFVRLEGLDDDDSVPSNFGNATEEKYDVADSFRSKSEQGEDLALSSLESGSIMSFSDNISLDSAALREHGSLIALPTEIAAGMGRINVRTGPPSAATNDDGERTIVSSAPSGAAIPPPEASQDMFAISPHPRFIADGVHSLSTTCTDCFSFEHFRDDGGSTEGCADDLESLPSRNIGYSSSIVLRRRTGGLAHLPGHDAAAFERVAEQMIRDSTSINSSMPHWYNRFSESDWDQFRIAAKAILSVLEPRAKSPPLLPLPPTPPPAALLRLGPSSGRGRQVSYCAEDHLPNDFVCSLCKDVIVGAITLDCDCGPATVCALCWENGPGTEDGRISQDFADQMGFVWIEKASSRCPCCDGNVNSKVHCHALDVAILHIINDLPECQDNLILLKENYYSRLAAWRATVYDRNETRSRQISAENDELLARLIAEEERVFWRQDGPEAREESRSNSLNGILFLGQTAVALVVATVASIGLNTIARR